MDEWTNTQGTVIYMKSFISATLVVATFASANTAHAQGYPFSQRGSVTQTVAFTTISI